MKFRTGLVIGLGVGYVLGARAGRERYEQICRSAQRIAKDERIRSVLRAADRRSAPAREAAGNGLMAASERVKAATTR